MATTSATVPLGTPLPQFALPDLAGHVVTSTAFAGRALLVVVACNHCPYVRHVEAGLATVVRRHPALQVVAICPNDAEASPDDAPAGLAAQADRAGWTFPYLVDPDQATARALGAACTPDLFLYSANGELAYHGALDGSTPGNGVPVTGDLLDAAIGHVLADEPVPPPHRPALGCSIKWRS